MLTVGMLPFMVARWPSCRATSRKSLSLSTPLPGGRSNGHTQSTPISKKIADGLHTLAVKMKVQQSAVATHLVGDRLDDGITPTCATGSNR